MFEIDSNQNITLHQGDTLALAIAFDGRGLAEADRLVFGVKNLATEETYIQRVLVPEITTNRVYVYLSNSDTESLRIGRYIWDLRAVYGANAEVTSGAEVDTLLVKNFIVLEVASNV